MTGLLVTIFVIVSTVFLKQSQFKNALNNVAVWSDSLVLVRRPLGLWVLGPPSAPAQASHQASTAAAMHSKPTLQSPAELADSLVSPLQLYMPQVDPVVNNELSSLQLLALLGTN